MYFCGTDKPQERTGSASNHRRAQAAETEGGSCIFVCVCVRQTSIVVGAMYYYSSSVNGVKREKMACGVNVNIAV